MSSNVNVNGVSRVLTKLQSSITAGEYYEAHQMFRTLYFRYLTQKKYAELLELLYNGAQELLNHQQKASGADLSILLVDVLLKSETPPSREWLDKLTTLYSMIGPNIPERETFLMNIMTWSKLKYDKVGQPELHKNIAHIYWQEKNYTQARYHYMHSKDGSGCALMLIELHTERGLGSEIDLFIAQAVLQYLCIRNTTTAQETFVVYTEKHPSIKTIGPPYLFPLLNFIWFLLKAVESGKVATFTVLCEQYKPSLKRDPTYLQYLDQIGQLFFGVPAPRNQNNNMFGSIIQTFLNGLDNSDPSDEERPGTSQQTMDSAALD